MKNKILTGLTAIVLAGTPNMFSQKQLGIQGVEYKNYQDNSKYSLEIQDPFGKTNPNFGKRVYEKNNDQDEGELDFTVSPMGEFEVVTGEKIYLNQKQKYIPTVKVDKNGNILKQFEVYGLKAKTKKDLMKKIKKEKRKSESSFGYNYTLTNEDLEKILPVQIINRKSYIVWDGTKGEFTSENGKKYEILESSKQLPEIYMPLKGNFGIGINLECNNITLYSEKGFYQPVKESTQKLQEEYSKQKETKKVSEKKKQERKFIVIKKGDTLWKLFGKDWTEIQKLNPEIKPENLKSGMKIFIE